MINGKLKKPVEALTQADIDNETTKSGTVSGEQLAALGGGGGPEVLKPWTRTTALETNLFEGLDVSTLDYDDVYLEFRNVNSAKNGIQMVTLKLYSSGKVGPELVKSKGRVLGSGNTLVGASSNLFALFTATQGLLGASAEVRLFEHYQDAGNRVIAGYYSRGFNMSDYGGTGGTTNLLETTADFINGAYVGSAPLNELWLENGFSDVNITFQADYRILKREPTGL